VLRVEGARGEYWRQGRAARERLQGKTAVEGVSKLQRRQSLISGSMTSLEIEKLAPLLIWYYSSINTVLYSTSLTM